MQLTLPLLPHGATPINKNVSVDRSDGQWTYYFGMLPIYMHDEGDDAHFRLTVALMLRAGLCRACEIERVFGVTHNKVMRAQRQLADRGERSFFERSGPRRGGTVLTPTKLVEAQEMLNRGDAREEIARELCVKRDTLRKAINDGRLIEPDVAAVSQATTQSERSEQDASAAPEMGTACTRPDERIYAALGMIDGAPTVFEPCLDVPFGGVLCALPALLANGLLRGLELLGEVRGYYTRAHVLLTLAIMCLCRIRTVEKLRACPPGELGKLIGLDRIPEARCLRSKMDEMAADTHAEQWAAELAKQWMCSEPDSAGFLYVDGHVKVYGGNTKLPKRYVSRQRLCLRGISNYWVNDALGRPFFAIERQIDEGLLQCLRDDIVPRLLRDVPDQPTDEQLAADPLLFRFALVFDREGYSPAFFREMWDRHRIACLTYRKNCDDLWPVDEFRTTRAVMPRGETVEMRLGERGTLLGSGDAAIWVKEVRKLTENGHQTAVASTARGLPAERIAPQMFTRWCQENFFGYAMQHFPIDLLAEYGSESFTGTERVVNPAWREIDRQHRSARGKLSRRRAKFVEIDSEARAAPGHPRHESWETEKARLLEEMQALECEFKTLAGHRRNTEKHITWDELPEPDKFMKLPGTRRRLLNTVGMIAYRAETAMASLLCLDRSTMDMSEARTLVQALLAATADLHPDPDAKTLEIRLHTPSTPAATRAIRDLLAHLGETETTYPGTDLTMIFRMPEPPS